MGLEILGLENSIFFFEGGGEWGGWVVWGGGGQYLTTLHKLIQKS